MKFRKIAFALHLYIGSIVGMLLVAIALTGSLLVFSHEIDRALNPQLLRVVPQAEKIPLETVLKVVQKAYPDNQAINLSMPRSPQDICEISMLSKSEQLVSVYVNPYSGKIQGDRLWEKTLTGFLLTLHIQLFAGELGQTIVGICGIFTLLLTITGLCLWSGWRNLLRGFSLKWTAHWQRNLFDLHNVSGIFSVAFLLLIASTGSAIIFYAPFEEFIYQLTQTKPPPALTSHPGKSPQTLDEIVRQADTVLSGAETVWLSLPSTPEQTFKVRKKFPNDPHPNGNSVIYLDQYSGEILQVDNANSAPLATRILNSLYPWHIGSYGGIYLRVAHAIAGIAPLVLFVTGVLMWRSRHLAKFYRQKTLLQYKELAPLSQEWPWF